MDNPKLRLPRPFRRRAAAAAARERIVVPNPLAAAAGSIGAAYGDALRATRKAVATRARLDRHAVLELALELHRVEVGPAQPPAAPPPLPVDDAAVRRALGRDRASAEVERETAARHELHAAQQSAIDEAFERLLANDAEAVQWAVSRALAALPVDAGIVAAENTRVDLLLGYPGLDVVPETARSGPRTKEERGELYLRALAGASLATLKLAAAAAPAAERFRLLVLAPEEDAHPVLAADVSRAGLERASGTALARLESAGELHLATSGRNRTVVPLKRVGVVDDLLRVVDAAPGEALRSPNPFDLARLERERDARAASFLVRLG